MATCSRKYCDKVATEEVRGKLYCTECADIAYRFGFDKINTPQVEKEEPQEKSIKKEEVVQLYLDGSKQINVRQVVKYLKRKHTFITVKDATSRKPHIYIYEDGYYKLDGDIRLLKTVKDLFKDNWKSLYENEVTRYLKTENVVDRDKIHPPEHLINLKNGIYNLETDELEPHTPNYYFLYKIPVNYNPNATMPKIMRYFKSTLKQKYIDLSQEIFGYCLLWDYSIAGIFYLYGSGGNGKGVWIHLLTHMLGKENVAEKEIGKLMSNNFATSGLYGKLANICGEMSTSVMKSTDMLKRLSAGDNIDAEFKSKDAFSFPNMAKIITACNEIPECTDMTDGWVQRQYLISFMEKFRKTSRDITKLRKQLVSNRGEMEGLLFWSLQGLKRLLKNEKFTYENQEERYYMCKNSVEYFIENNYAHKDFGDYIEFAKVKSKYEKFCKENDIPPEKPEALGIRLSKLKYSKDRMLNDKGKWIWINRFLVEL